ncbi:PRC-barrel domain-containing protein [Lentibacillus sp. CBA3610]|nr:PRC-barrel domain-containing protein [Lentibacillus sp. CBA3610]QKY68963.1 hypothetical protein Len3610_04440 [Lentibacillus sp. CBA3610]
MITLSDLQIKEVIMMNDGKRLGHISDLEIDGDNGMNNGVGSWVIKR